MKKTAVWILIVIFPALVVGLCFLTIIASAFGSSNALSKEEIIKVVNNNQELLIQTLSEAKDPDYELCAELKNKGVKDIWVCEESEKRHAHIDFFCGGRGMDDYYGFYYVENDTPIGNEGIKNKLIKTNNGWQDNYDDYCTERIRENWFYYEMHY